MARPDYVVRNRAYWSQCAADYAARADDAWSRAEASWGIWGIPEGEVSLLKDIEGKEVLEDGCGTAYVSAWMARRGARVTGLDNCPSQLATARRMQQTHGPEFPLIHGIAEELPFRDETFDLVFSEYGAPIWSDPELWIPEAARVLRIGGDLVFLGNSSLLMLCVSDDEPDLPAGDQLVRDYFGMHRFEWPGDEGVEFHLGYGDWIRLFRTHGFEVVDLVELRAPEGAHSVYQHVSPQWARRWPAEQIWRVTKTP